MATITQELRDLEAACEAACHEFDWLSPKGAPNYRLLYSHPLTFEYRAPLMILGIHPHGSPADADLFPASLAYSREGYSAYLDESWDGKTPGSARFQVVAQQIASMFGDDPQAVLRRTASANAIPFRAPSLARFSRAIINWSLGIVKRLVEAVQPRVLVLMGGDRVLFDVVRRALRGTTVSSDAATYGENRQTFREVTVEEGTERSVLFGLPGSAMQQAIPALAARVRDLQLAPVV